MPNPSSISRRMESCLKALRINSYEEALINFFPALDKTAKRRRLKDNVGQRIRGFISDQEVIITAVSTGNILRGISINGVTFPEAIYKYGRTSVMHEGELDPRLTFNNSATIQIGDVWNLPTSYITGLCVGVIVAPENTAEHIESNISLSIFGRQFDINELWGAESIIKEMICNRFGSRDVFR